MSRKPSPEVAAILAANRCVRFLPKGALPRVLDEEGTRLCGWCHSPLDRRSIAWCSDDCGDEFWVRTSRSHAAALVYRRDQGVCAMCGLDAEQVLRIVDRLRERSERRWLRSGETREPTDRDAARWQRLRTELTNRGYGLVDRWHTPLLWEADHIVPVIEGGGCCGLENYRTLCIPCHRAQTRNLRSRMRRQRSLAL